MEEPFGFMIPEMFVHVLNWFAEKLQPLCDRLHPGSPEIELHLEGPRTKKLGSPGDDTTVTELVMIAFRTKGPPIPSDWAPECCTVGWEDVREPLGPVMQFRFAPLGGGTYVFASCVERLPTVQWLFEDLLRHVEDRYPEIGPLSQKYRTKREIQRIERIERYTKMASGAAVAAIESGPVTAAGDATIAAASEAPIAQPAGAAAVNKPYRMSQEMRERYKLSRRLHDRHRGWTCGDIADELNATLKAADLRTVKRVGDELKCQDINNAFDAAHREDPDNPQFEAGYDRLGERRPKDW